MNYVTSTHLWTLTGSLLAEWLGHTSKRHDLSVLVQKSLIMLKTLGQMVYMLLMYQSYLNQKNIFKTEVVIWKRFIVINKGCKFACYSRHKPQAWNLDSWLMCKIDFIKSQRWHKKQLINLWSVSLVILCNNYIFLRSLCVFLYGLTWNHTLSPQGYGRSRHTQSPCVHIYILPFSAT